MVSAKHVAVAASACPAGAVEDLADALDMALEAHRATPSALLSRAEEAATSKISITGAVPEAAPQVDPLAPEKVAQSLEGMIEAGLRSHEGSMRGGSAALTALNRSTSACSLHSIDCSSSREGSMRGANDAFESLFLAEAN